jgi:hypothetical protein
LEQLERDYLESEFDRIRNFAGMWSRNFCDRVCLPSDKKVLDFSQKILGFAFNGVPEKNISARPR